MKKVCMIVDWNMYDVMRHFSEKFKEALERKGVEVRVIDADRKPLRADMFEFFKDDPPDFTCSFNTFERLPNGLFLWDMLHTPHVLFTLDPALYFLEYTKSPYSILTSPDRFELEGLKTQFDRAFFMPHGVEPDIKLGNEERDLDVVFFGSCFDYKAWRKNWEECLPKELWGVIEFAIDIVFTNNNVPLSDALSSAWGASRLDPALGQEYLLVMFHYLSRYVRGKDRVELIRSIKDAKVHVFGEVPPDNIKQVSSWSAYLGEQSNVELHSPVSFAESIEILKKSKICLNTMPFFRNGSHERVFTGSAAGAVVLSSESLYLRETLIDGEDILYYRSKHWEDVNDKVNDLLKNPSKLKDIAESGRQKILKHHTWDNRVEMLQAGLSSIERTAGGIVARA